MRWGEQHVTSMDVRKNYYEILGVAPTADARTVKAAFRALVKQFHPDTTADQEAHAEARFRDVNEAYKVLGGVQSRREYDKRREAARTGAATQEQDLSSGVETEPFTDLEVDALANAPPEQAE
jgi:curved DNA-binding protein CbpA